MTDLFAEKKPRRDRRVMMHVIDAGQGMAEFECKKCGTVAGWVKASPEEIRRGIPCEICNAEEPQTCSG